MKNIELELKFKVNDLREIENRLVKLGAKFDKEVESTDTYFLVPENKDGRKYFRIREQDGEGEIAYHFVKSAHRTDEWEAGIVDTEMIKEILQKVGHGIDVVVKKIRRKYRYKNSEIVLDNVDSLGAFVEIEAGSASRISEIVRELGLDEKSAIKTMGYPDMIRDHWLDGKKLE